MVFTGTKSKIHAAVIARPIRNRFIQDIMRRSISLLLIGLMLATSLGISTPSSAETSARQEVQDVDCSGYSFEDLFEYNFAYFDIEIGDDWNTASFDANAWVNGSNAAIVRDNLDGLFEGFEAFGGNDDWISTDERDNVRDIGPMCISDMETRMGIKEGDTHRGEIDWSNLSFVEDGIGLDEVDLIPQTHPNKRDCSSRLGASNDCEEVPVSATDNLEISMFVKDGENHNAQFTQLANKGVSNFTLAFNVSNISNAHVKFTFPPVQGLRINTYGIMENHTDDPLFREKTTEIESLDEFSHSVNYLPSGSLVLDIDTVFDRTKGEDIVRNIFFDFTTQEAPDTEPPQWSSIAPQNGTILPVDTAAIQSIAIQGEQLDNWATTTNGLSLNMICSFSEEDWSGERSGNGDYLVNPGTDYKSEASCKMVNPFGVESETRTWHFGNPLSITGVSGEYEGAVSIQINPTGLISSAELEIMAAQGSILGTPTLVDMSSDPTSTEVDISNLNPGSFKIKYKVISEDLHFNLETEIDLSMEKQSQPPVLDVPERFDGSVVSWADDYYSFTIRGTVFEPESEDVTIEISVCDQKVKTTTPTNNEWEASIPITACTGNSGDTYPVTIKATDASGKSSEFNLTVADPFASPDSTSSDDVMEIVDETSSGLPTISMLSTIMICLGAAFLVTRRNDQL